MRKMKDSKIEWVGEIPETWDIQRIGGFYSLRNEKVSDKIYPPLSVTMKGVVSQLETAAKTNDGDNRKLVRKGDFAINSRSDRRGSCGISEYDGSVSLINMVLMPRGKTNNRYCDWLFHTIQFADEFYKWGHGIVDDLWTTRWEDMKRISIPVPPIEEQQRIADFLDRECERIDGLKADIEAQIETLEKYKRSVITEAVTHGLNPDVPMKNSGVGCIEEIPAHWTVAPLKSKFSFGKGLSITKADLIDAGVKVISYGQIHAKYNKSYYVDNRLYRFVPDQYLKTESAALVQQGDFIFADTSEDVEGAGNFVYIDKSDLIFAGYHCITLKNRSCNYGKYLAFLFMSQKWKNQVQCRVNGVKLFSITKKHLAESMLILPPLSEQQAIADYLDEKCAQIDELISQKHSQIETLETYKKSLIFEYVTGKKEVV